MIAPMAEPKDDSHPTRPSLLHRLKDWDDQESWKEFFNTYWKLIYGVAVKAGLSDDEAQEVVQETVIRVAKKMGEFKADPAFGSFKSWLLHLTRWRIADQLGKRHLQSQPGQRASQDTSRTSTVERIPDASALNLDAVWDEEWSKNIVDAALEKIKRRVSSKQYQIFYLHVIKELPAREVTKALGVNLGQVYLARHRVSALVKKEIKNLERKMI